MVSLHVSPYWLIPIAAVLICAVRLSQRLLLSTRRAAQSAISPEEYRSFRLIAKTNVTPGTPNASTFLFRFALPHASSVLGLPCGKHILLRCKDADGKSISRPYTPVSPPDSRGYFELLVKLYPTGKMSQFLAALKLGEEVEVRGPLGLLEYKGHGLLKLNRAGVWQERRVRRIGMIAGGSGITPMHQVIHHVTSSLPASPSFSASKLGASAFSLSSLLSLLSTFLLPSASVPSSSSSPDSTRLSFIYANVTEADILLRSELDRTAAALPSSFSVFYTINPPREGETLPSNWKGGVGFVSREMITKQLPAPDDSDSIVLLCGPPPMMTAMQSLLQQMGYPAEQVWTF
jgi:cytochrome-b5 reductase